MAINPIGWFEIYVDDMDRAKKFYEDVLKISLEKLDVPADVGSSPVMYSFNMNMEQYGSSGALVKMEGFPAGGASTIVYFECEDCASEEARVVAAGGKVETSKMSLGEFGFCSLVFDSEGNMIGLHSNK